MSPRISEQAIEALTLLAWPGVGVARARTLLLSLSPGETLLEIAQARHPRSAPGDEAAQTLVRARAEKIVGDCEAQGIAVLSLADLDAYPSQLRTISDAPPVLYVHGKIAALARQSIAVVGTRKASAAGGRAAHSIGEYLARQDIAVVSGLALGIDSAAHEGALDGGGVTIAVLAHGLDVVAPSTNRGLADRILTAGGALVSEHPPGVPPRPAEFAKRNRIQSGLSKMSIIVESGREGGAMIHARYAREQGRPICAILSDGQGHNRGGADRLLRELGAVPARSSKDLEAVLARVLGPALDGAAMAPHQTTLEW